jgi:uncharacterized membrane protein
MKKIINNLQVISFILILPAIMVAYLNSDKKEANSVEKNSMVRKVALPVNEAAGVFRMIKSF